MRNSVVLPRATTDHLQVGDLLKNQDTEGKVFGRIKAIARPAKSSWATFRLDPEDKG